MKLALITDTPRTNSATTRAYTEQTLAAAAEAAKLPMPDFKIFAAVPDDQPGGGVPGIALIREHRAALFERVNAFAPDAIVTMGAAALHAMYDTTPLMKLGKEFGCMRWWPGGESVDQIPLTPSVAPYHVVRRNMDLHRDFAWSLHKALTQLEPLPPMEIELTVVRTSAELNDALNVLEGHDVVGVDVETTGLRSFSDDVLAVGLGAMTSDETGVAVVVPRALLGDPTVQDLLADAVWRISRRSVGHNFKFDMQFLERVVGWPDERASIGDTLLLSHLLDERPSRLNSRARGSGLKDLVAQRFDHQYGFDFEEFYEAGEQADFDAMHAYLGEDVVYTARLWKAIVKDINDEGSRVLETHDRLLMPAARAISRCEWLGAPVDIEWVLDTAEMLDRRIERRRAALENGVARLTLTLDIDNIDSTQQIADLMYDEWLMTPDIRKNGRAVIGDRSTDKDHIEAAVAKYLGTDKDRQARWLRSLLRLRKDIKTRTTYQNSIIEKMDDDGRVRAGFLLHGTATGRLSSQGPNLQNIPAVKRVGADQVRPMRRAFAPGPGRVWCDVDYSQLELRVAAGISGDEAMADLFRSGRDIHREIASSIFSKAPEDISAAERFLAKAVSFGIIYGRSGRALATGTEMEYAKSLGMTPWTEQQADMFIKKFLRSYPKLQQWITTMHQTVPKQGYVESPFGRRRRFPLIMKHELGSIQRQAVNTPVQSAASDLCLQALVRIQRRLEDLDADVLFSVHDSICIEAAEELVPTIEAICREEMEQPFGEVGVPLTVDFSYGPDWATAGGWNA